jgi:hypothetical protein
MEYVRTKNKSRPELEQRCFRCDFFQETRGVKRSKMFCSKESRTILYSEARPSPAWCPRREK